MSDRGPLAPQGAGPARSGRHSASRAKAPRAGRRRRRSAGALIFGIAGLVVVLAAAVAVWWVLFRPVSPQTAGRAVTVVVPKGSSSDAVATMLADDGVVASPTMFRLRAAMLGAIDSLKAGTYDLKTGSSYDAVIARLQAGPSVTYFTLTIPEGWTITQIAQRVEAKTGIPSSDFTALATTGRSKFDFPFLAQDQTSSLEGYLFPKTYLVKKGTTADALIRMMLVQYGEETSSLDLSYARSKNLTLRDVTIIASIIEHEVSLDKDRPLVASVIYNRLKAHMRLQLDSTVEYVVGGKPRLSLQDLKTPSPYNTYLHQGLPPGPIDNPGLASLRAAAMPANTAYLYYVLTRKDGSQSFAVTYQQFLALKAQAKKGLR